MRLNRFKLVEQPATLFTKPFYQIHTVEGIVLGHAIEDKAIAEAIYSWLLTAEADYAQQELGDDDQC